MTTINLIPQEIVQTTCRKQRLIRWAGIVAASTVLAALPLAWRVAQDAQSARLRTGIDRLESDRAEIQSKLLRATAQAVDLSAELERSRAFRAKRSWSGIVALIAASLPQDCWLQSIATDPEAPAAGAARSAAVPMQTNAPAAQEKVVIEAPRKLRMVGYSTNDAKPLSFVGNLRESKAFTRVALQKAVRAPGASADETLYQFEVLCEW